MNYDHYDLVQDLYYNFATVEGVEDEFLIAIRHIAKDLESAHPEISGKLDFLPMKCRKKHDLQRI
tara:strand:+ start:547 stop:741 length:195 start_codon:yes stop_codon:yes gene_type:complete